MSRMDTPEIDADGDYAVMAHQSAALARGTNRAKAALHQALDRYLDSVFVMADNPPLGKIPKGRVLKHPRAIQSVGVMTGCDLLLHALTRTNSLCALRPVAEALLETAETHQEGGNIATTFNEAVRRLERHAAAGEHRR